MEGKYSRIFQAVENNGKRIIFTREIANSWTMPYLWPDGHLLVGIKSESLRVDSRGLPKTWVTVQKNVDRDFLPYATVTGDFQLTFVVPCHMVRVRTNLISRLFFVYEMP